MAVDTASFHIPSPSCIETGSQWWESDLCMDGCRTNTSNSDELGFFGESLEVLDHLHFELTFALCGFAFALLTKMLHMPMPIMPKQQRSSKREGGSSASLKTRGGPVAQTEDNEKKNMKEQQLQLKAKLSLSSPVHRVSPSSTPSSSRASSKAHTMGKAASAPSTPMPCSPQSFQNHMTRLISDNSKEGVCQERLFAQRLLAACGKERGRPLKLYREALANGITFEVLQPVELRQLYMALVLAAFRTDGEVDSVVSLLQDLSRCQSVSSLPFNLLTLAVKRLAQRRCFRQCLAAYDIAASTLPSSKQHKMPSDDVSSIDDREFWAALLLSAVEVGQLYRCPVFWEALTRTGTAAPQDYMCMLRAVALKKDWQQSVQLIKELLSRGFIPDTAMVNAAVITCVEAQQLQAASSVLEIVGSCSAQFYLDILAYNTLMKGYAAVDAVDEMFSLLANMRGHGVAATQVTYGIVLDACVNRGDLERAGAVFQDMITGGCKMNTVLYTTLIKGFAKADRVDKAMEVYDHMRSQGGIQPDTITFSVLIKAHSDAGMMTGAQELLHSMLEFEYRPDEIILNNLLLGCVRTNDVSLAKKFLNDLVVDGNVRPSNATGSILIKLYAKCNLLEEALKMLQAMPTELGVVPEPRLWAQLLHASVRERQGRRAVEIFQSMAKVSCLDAVVTAKVLSTCVNFNMFETAADLLRVAEDGGCAVSRDVADSVLTALERKRRYGDSYPQRCR